MSTFEGAIGPVLEHEGGELVPDDHGRGPSKWGVTLATAREIYPLWGPADIWNLDRASATEFYRVAFWNFYRIGRIADQALAGKLLDLAVNIGGVTAVKLLQAALRVRADGLIGPITAAAANARPAFALSELRRLAANYYRALVRKRPEYVSCLVGWLVRLAS